MFHWITSSAVANSVSGMVRPRALAVVLNIFRLAWRLFPDVARRMAPLPRATGPATTEKREQFLGMLARRWHPCCPLPGDFGTSAGSYPEKLNGFWCVRKAPMTGYGPGCVMSPAGERRRDIPARPNLASNCASSASTSGRRGAPVLPPNRVHLSPAEAAANRITPASPAGGRYARLSSIKPPVHMSVGGKAQPSERPPWPAIELASRPALRRGKYDPHRMPRGDRCPTV
jgi:hypothetical protein